MSRMLTIKELAPKLDYPGFWDLKKLYFLKAILSICGKNSRITKADLPTIGKLIEDSINSQFETPTSKNSKPIKIYLFNKTEQKICNDVINHLQKNNWGSCSFFQIKTKPYRPSLLPMEEVELVQLGMVNNLRRRFWAGQLDIKKNIPIIAVLEAVASTGITYKHIMTSIASHGLNDLAKGYLKLLVSKEMNLSTTLPVSAKTQLLFQWCQDNKITLEQFNKKLRHPLYKSPVSNSSYYALNDLLLALKKQPYYAGVESILIAQLHNDLLPVPRPTPYSYLQSQCTIPTIIRRDKPKSTQLEETNEELELSKLLSNEMEEREDLAELDFPDIDAESVFPWAQQCSITLQQIRFKLRKKLTNNNGKYTNGKVGEDFVIKLTEDAFKETLDRTYKLAIESASKVEIKAINETRSQIKENFTGLHLAIHRIHHHLIDEQNTLDTCLSEMSGLFKYGFLRYSGSANLSNWDEEDFEILINDYLFDRENETLSEETRLNLMSSLRGLVGYCKKQFGLFKNIKFAPRTKGFVIRTRRNHVFGPLEFDLLKVDQDPVALLAFYAGLRSGEIANLTLNDVVTSPFELVIYVRKGKTPSAKRSLPLHLIAPPEVIQVIRAYTTLRWDFYNEYKKDAKSRDETILTPKEVYLLSTSGDCRTNTARTAVRQTLDKLKDEAGSEVDLHLLRHSFASHLFLRWYTCRHPDFVAQLSDQQHWFFSEEGLDNLRIFFGEKPGKPIPDTNITAFVHIMKLFGHKTTKTLFQVYIHSFDTVIQHALKKSQEADDEEIILGKLIAELVPKMRSSRSQAKLKSRKAMDLVSLLKNTL